MPLPTRVKYQTAVQNPRICFRDPDLANSTARCSANGMPLTYSGGFATTFRMRNAGVDWAVRCFTRPVAQLARRYGIIERYISKDKPAFLASAALLPGGIQIDSHWQPIIKMEWLSGYTLNAYIETQLRAASKIIKLRDELVGVANAMQAKQMAHGDLQHGNIIVFDGRPRLVDYDGIYLPDLKGMVPDELGHKHYQHPQRARGDWGPEMDRFSLIALYVGLSAIALRRELWDTFNCGENVLFTKSDFAEPAASELFDELCGIAAIEKMSKDFREICAGPLIGVPALEEFIARLMAPSGQVKIVGKVTETYGEGANPSYSAAITPKHPTCIVFLIDQSGSMGAPYAGAQAGRSKAAVLADQINALLAELTILCIQGSEQVRDFFHVAVIGYGSKVQSVFGGLIPVSEVFAQARLVVIEDPRTGASVMSPVWIEAVADGMTPMCEALAQAQMLVEEWVSAHPKCFPPIVINFTGGEANDGDPVDKARRLTGVASADGAVLLVNAYFSSVAGAAIEFPAAPAALPVDPYALKLFEMSSVIPDAIIAMLRPYGIHFDDGARGMVFNSDDMAVAHLFHIIETT